MAGSPSRLPLRASKQAGRPLANTAETAVIHPPALLRSIAQRFLSRNDADGITKEMRVKGLSIHP